jgi:hypothetical protein
MAAPAYKLTTWAEIGYYYSTFAQGLITDDLSGTPLSNFQTWIENYATEEVLLYLGARYKNLQDLSTSNVVRMWATILGAYRVSTRRGNPELFQGARDETIGLLRQVQLGELSLPDVDTNSANAISMHNYSYDPRFLANPIRIAHDGLPLNNDNPNNKPRYPVFPIQ